MTNQIVRASRSIASNIAEGWGKHIYENEFNKHLVYCMGSVEEIKVWLQFPKKCGYISSDDYDTLSFKCGQLGSKIFKLYEKLENSITFNF